MADTLAQSVGVDIAKDTLEVHLDPAGASRRFGNHAKGRAALIAWLKGCRVARVAFEPSGAYHHAVERRLAAAGLPLVKVNPRQARRFAEAIGRQAKLWSSGRPGAGPGEPTRSTPPCAPAARRCSSRRCGPR
jgi:transposase